MASNAALIAANASRWERARLTRTSEFNPVAKRLVSRKERYQGIEAATGVPWFVIAVIHEREAGVDAQFKGNIANGQPWSRKTTIVPKGRGPFASFEEAAFDALMNCAPFAGKWKDWSVGGALTLLEQYNGLGYAQRKKPSPYIWSGTDQYVKGKYVADHEYDPEAVDKQLGCAGVLMAMQQLDPSIEFTAAAKKPRPAQPPAPAPVVVTPPPAAVKKPGIWATLWSALRGKDAAAVTAPVRERPGLAANGDAALYDQQDMLSKKGYAEVGQPDGLLGARTAAAIRAFRLENGLPASDAIDAKFAAALLAAGPRKVAQARVEASAQDLRAKGNSQINLLDNFGLLGKLLLGVGAGGAVDQSGILSKANDTLQQAQDALGTVTTIATSIIGVVQWCFAHWWIFAIVGGGYLIFKVAMGVLNVVVLFRQGFLARADR